LLELLAGDALATLPKLVALWFATSSKPLTQTSLAPHLVMPAKAGIALQLVRLRRSLRVEHELSSAVGQEQSLMRLVEQLLQTGIYHLYSGFKCWLQPMQI